MVVVVVVVAAAVHCILVVGQADRAEIGVVAEVFPGDTQCQCSIVLYIPMAEASEEKQFCG